MNSRPKQKPFRDRTIAGIREGVGLSNSISSKSPGFSRIPAYNVMPPWLISVPRPSTTVVAKPFDVTTRTGKSTGIRSQRRVFSGLDAIFGHHLRTATSLQITKVPHTPWPRVRKYGCTATRLHPVTIPHRECLVQSACERARKNMPGNVHVAAGHYGQG